MNDLLKQLASEAKLHMVSEPRMEQFAQLVARHCANICEDLSFTPEGPSHEAKYQRGLCADAIRKEFGVPAEFRKSS